MKRATIEPFIIPQEKLDKLKAVLENPKLSELYKKLMKRQISGSCLSCGQMPTKIAKYRKYGIIVVEKYCDECLERINA